MKNLTHKTFQKLYFGSLFILSTIMLSAQTKVALHTGLHSANVSANGLNTEIIDFESIHRFSAGVSVERSIDNNLSLKTGLFYKEKGFKISESIPLNILDIDVPIGLKVSTEIKTLNMPFLLNYNIKTTSGLTPYIMAGPSINYAMSGAIKTKATAIFDFTLTNTPLNLDSEDFNRIGIEGIVGGGLKIPYGKGELTTELTYNHSLTNFTSDNFIVDAAIRTKGLSFSVGYGMYF